MTLDVQQVALMCRSSGTKKIVEANVVQGRAGLKAGDVPPKGAVIQVSPHHHRHRIPAD